MGRTSDLLMQPLPWDFEGQSYPLAPCTGEIELAYTNWLEMRARDKIARRKDQLMQTGDYSMHMEIWQQRVDADEYDFAGYTSFASRQHEPGQKYLLFLLLTKQTRTVTLDLVDRIYRDIEARNELFNQKEGSPLGLVWRVLAQARPTSPEVQQPAPPENEAA